MLSRAALVGLTILLAVVVTNGQSTGTCPTIEVTGPAGITQVGDSMAFTAMVNRPDDAPIEYEWKVSVGTIMSGQGTPSIAVRTDRSLQGAAVTAFLSVKGLPARCKNSASQEGRVECGGDPPLIDEYGELKQRAEIARLDDVVATHTSHPDWAIFVIEYDVRSFKEG